MAFPEDAVNPFLGCMSGTLTWPAIGGPFGLPNLALSGFGSMFGGITWALDFLPPDPMDLPSLPIPFNIFTNPFFGSLNFPGGYAFDIGLVIPGAPTINYGAGPPQFNAPGFVLLGLSTIGLAFEIITGIVQSIIDLSLELPSLGLIISTLEGIMLGLGLTGLGVPNFVACFSQAIFDMITASF